MIFIVQTPEESSSRKLRWLSYALIFGLTLAATTVMMLCPCDTVGIHDHQAIFLVALAAVFAIAAACMAYRSMSHDSGITGFLRAVIALAIVGVGVYAELLIAMKVVARMASRQ